MPKKRQASKKRSTAGSNESSEDEQRSSRRPPRAPTTRRQTRKTVAAESAAPVRRQRRVTRSMTRSVSRDIDSDDEEDRPSKKKASGRQRRRRRSSSTDDDVTDSPAPKRPRTRQRSSLSRPTTETTPPSAALPAPSPATSDSAVAAGTGTATVDQGSPGSQTEVSTAVETTEAPPVAATTTTDAAAASPPRSDGQATEKSDVFVLDRALYDEARTSVDEVLAGDLSDDVLQNAVLNAFQRQVSRGDTLDPEGAMSHIINSHFMGDEAAMAELMKEPAGIRLAEPTAMGTAQSDDVRHFFIWKRKRSLCRWWCERERVEFNVSDPKLLQNVDQMIRSLLIPPKEFLQSALHIPYVLLNDRQQVVVLTAALLETCPASHAASAHAAPEFEVVVVDEIAPERNREAMWESSRFIPFSRLNRSTQSRLFRLLCLLVLQVFLLKIITRAPYHRLPAIVWHFAVEGPLGFLPVLMPHSRMATWSPAASLSVDHGPEVSLAEWVLHRVVSLLALFPLLCGLVGIFRVASLHDLMQWVRERWYFSLECTLWLLRTHWLGLSPSPAQQQPARPARIRVFARRYPFFSWIVLTGLLFLAQAAVREAIEGVLPEVVTPTIHAWVQHSSGAVYWVLRRLWVQRPSALLQSAIIASITVFLEWCLEKYTDETMPFGDAVAAFLCCKKVTKGNRRQRRVVPSWDENIVWRRANIMWEHDKDDVHVTYWFSLIWHVGEVIEQPKHKAETKKTAAPLPAAPAGTQEPNVTEDTEARQEDTGAGAIIGAARSPSQDSAPENEGDNHLPQEDGEALHPSGKRRDLPEEESDVELALLTDGPKPTLAEAVTKQMDDRGFQWWQKHLRAAVGFNPDPLSCDLLLSSPVHHRRHMVVSQPFVAWHSWQRVLRAGSAMRARTADPQGKASTVVKRIASKVGVDDLVTPLGLDEWAAELKSLDASTFIGHRMGTVAYTRSWSGYLRQHLGRPGSFLRLLAPLTLLTIVASAVVRFTQGGWTGLLWAGEMQDVLPASYFGNVWSVHLGHSFRNPHLATVLRTELQESLGAAFGYRAIASSLLGFGLASSLFLVLELLLWPIALEWTQRTAESALGEASFVRTSQLSLWQWTKGLLLQAYQWVLQRTVRLLLSSFVLITVGVTVFLGATMLRTRAAGVAFLLVLVVVTPWLLVRIGGFAIAPIEEPGEGGPRPSGCGAYAMITVCGLIAAALPGVVLRFPLNILWPILFLACFVHEIACQLEGFRWLQIWGPEPLHVIAGISVQNVTLWVWGHVQQLARTVAELLLPLAAAWYIATQVELFGVSVAAWEPVRSFLLRDVAFALHGIPIAGEALERVLCDFLVPVCFDGIVPLFLWTWTQALHVGEEIRTTLLSYMRGSAVQEIS